jgi:hypothetical protein
MVSFLGNITSSPGVGGVRGGDCDAGAESFDDERDSRLLYVVRHGLQREHRIDTTDCHTLRNLG